MSQPRPIVLVHGAFHGAWCWAPLQAELDSRGVPSYAVDLPGHGASTEPLQDMHGDAAAVERLLERLGEEVVLVGHSYGGAVISQAGLAGNVARLVYLSALVIDVEESASAVMAGLPQSTAIPGKLMQRRDDGIMAANAELAAVAFYNTCTPQMAAAAAARLSPQRAATMKQPASRAAWRTVPSTYVRCLADNAVPLAAQDQLAQRCTDVATLDADHSPFLCQPVELADILEPLARR